MNIKNILKDANFIDLMNYASNIKIDAFETIQENKAFGIKRSKHRISYHKVVSNFNMYDSCFDNYTKAMQSLKNLYTAYTSEYSTIDEFAEVLFENLKNYVVLTNVLPSNNISKRVLTQSEINYYDAKKVEYLKNVLTRPIPSLNMLSAAKVLEDSETEKVADFIDHCELIVDQILDDLGRDKTNTKLRNAILHEYLVIYLPESYLVGDNLTTQKIEINKTRFDGTDLNYKNTPDQLKVLAFLENFILANREGFTSNNVGFDGFRFFNTKTGNSISANTLNLHKTKLANADRYLQSNFVLNEDFAKALLIYPKKFAKIRGRNCIKTTSVIDGDTIETTKILYRKKYITKDNKKNRYFDENLEMGNFCKVREFNKTKGTFSYMLFYYPDYEGKYPIQIFRIDKVEEFFKGAPASHNLRGKEKIETTLHTHTYNIIDAVLKNYTKDESLGKMDLSHIFATPKGLDKKIIEEYFDCFCGIHGLYLKRVNQAKFAKMFGKYEPVEMGN